MSQVLKNTKITTIRWTANEWKAVIAHFRDARRHDILTTQHKINEALSIGQAALPKDRQRKNPGFRIPAALHSWAKKNHNIHPRKSKLQVYPKVIQDDLSFDAPKLVMISTKVPKEAVKEALAKTVGALVAKPAPMATINAVDIADIYMVLCEIRDRLPALPTSASEPTAPNPAAESPTPAKSEKPRLPRVLLVGPMPRQRKLLQDSFIGRANIMMAWSAEGSSAHSMPSCEHVVFNTKFTTHSKFFKVKAQAAQIGASFTMVSGGTTSIKIAVEKILSFSSS